MSLFGPAEWAMVGAISAQATSVAYLRSPRLKALVCSLPIPFTTASLSLRTPVNVHHMLALWLLLLFAVTVRHLHSLRGWPIVAAIASGASLYVALGAFLHRMLPDSGPLFWMTGICTVTVGLWLLARMPQRQETSWRSPLPPLVKVPILTGIIALMVLLKGVLGGFMALFPIMSSVGSYEARFSLWTLVRQFPVIMITLAPMFMAMRLVPAGWGWGPALLIGWAAFAAVFVPLTWLDCASGCRLPDDAGGDDQQMAQMTQTG